MQLLRQKGVFDLDEVEIGIIEANGDISIQKKPEKASPALEDMGLRKVSSGITYPVIIDGLFQLEVMKELSINKDYILSFYHLLLMGIVSM